MTKAPNNRTIHLSSGEVKKYSRKLKILSEKVIAEEIVGSVINQDFFNAVNFLPGQFVDLLFIDPPYNLTKDYKSTVFKERSNSEYTKWFENVISNIFPLLKKTASVYVCSDWRSSNSIYEVLKKFFIIRNRITWEERKRTRL